jgi:hypothetical protein
LLLLLTQLSIFAQDASPTVSVLPQADLHGFAEVPDSAEQRQFVEEHSFDNQSFRQQQRQRVGIDTAPLAQSFKQVRMIYLVPSDKAVRADYQNALANAIADLQRFYRNQLGGGYAFALHSPAVEVYQTPHTAAFYSTGNNSRAGGFYESVLADGFALTGGGFNDPNYRWVFYVDADLICGQYVGGTSGIALLPANDLRGLTSQPTIPTCPNEQSQTLSVNRWIGGLGHELGHAFNLPHPAGCDGGHCNGGQYAYLSLMFAGYGVYPNTYFLDENKTQLLAGGFFTVLTYDISGRVTTNANAPVSGTTITINETQATAVSDANGNFSFTNLPAGNNYTLSVAKTNFHFAPSSMLFNSLNQNQIANFTASVNNGNPILISEETSTRALAFDSVLHLREPFQTAYDYSWGVDRRTRLTLFTANLELAANENPSTVTAEAEDSAHRVYPLEVESVGKVAGVDWLNCIVVKLNDEMGDVGDVLVRITYHNAASNRVRVGIGHTGGGLPDDAGAIPTPGRPPQ